MVLKKVDVMYSTSHGTWSDARDVAKWNRSNWSWQEGTGKAPCAGEYSNLIKVVADHCQKTKATLQKVIFTQLRVTPKIRMVSRWRAWTNQSRSAESKPSDDGRLVEQGIDGLMAFLRGAVNPNLLAPHKRKIMFEQKRSYYLLTYLWEQIKSDEMISVHERSATGPRD